MNSNCFKFTSLVFVFILSLTRTWAAPAEVPAPDFEHSAVKSFQNVESENVNMVLTFKLREVKGSKPFKYDVQFYLDGKECMPNDGEMKCQVNGKRNPKTGKIELPRSMPFKTRLTPQAGDSTVSGGFTAVTFEGVTSFNSTSTVFGNSMEMGGTFSSQFLETASNGQLGIGAYDINAAGDVSFSNVSYEITVRDSANNTD